MFGQRLPKKWHKNSCATWTCYGGLTNQLDMKMGLINIEYWRLRGRTCSSILENPGVASGQWEGPISQIWQNASASATTQAGRTCCTLHFEMLLREGRTSAETSKGKNKSDLSSKEKQSRDEQWHYEPNLIVTSFVIRIRHFWASSTKEYESNWLFLFYPGELDVKILNLLDWCFLVPRSQAKGTAPPNSPKNFKIPNYRPPKPSY